MIPLVAAGAVSLVSSIASTWKAHAESAAAAKAAKGADFQKTLSTAAAQATAATEQQKAQALPADLQTVAQQLLQVPDVQSMARGNPGAGVSLQFTASGDLFASQAGGLRRITVTPQVQQELQQLNGTMRSAAAGANGGVAHVTGEIASGHVPVQMNLAAV